jgi:uncharacterized repeat protein (TIGR01451 family)
MITRVVHWKRRRGSKLLVIGAILVVAGVTAATVYAVFLTDSGTVDVQVTSKATSKVDIQTTGGAFVSYFGDSDTTFGASGTGQFNPFVRLQASPAEQGFNTNAAVTFDAKTGTWTHAIKVSEIPQRPCPDQNPSPPPAAGSETCFELFNDVNENNTAKNIALNKVDIWFTQDPNLTGYPFTATSTTTDQYTFNGTILINDVNQGSGRGDLRFDIPVSKFNVPSNCNYGNPNCITYFVLYSQWGSPPATSTYSSEGGFEEWKVKIYPTPPDIQVVKTPDSESTGAGTVTAGSNAVFTIVTTNNGPITATGVTMTDVLPGPATTSWTVGGADAASCGTNPHAGLSTVTCAFGDVPFPGSKTITLTAATTTADCTRTGTVTGDIDNTASVSATNEDQTALGNNSDHGDVHVACSDIKVVKTPDSESTGAGTVTAGSNAVFTIVTTNIGSITATAVTMTDVLPGPATRSWTVGGADAASCGTNPHAGLSTLTCTFGDVLAAGTKTITLTAATTAVDCTSGTPTGDMNNTANVSATNEDQTKLSDDSDHGDVHVVCAAIQILKESSKTGHPLVLKAGAVFSITGPGGYSKTVTDNGTGSIDEDSTIGKVCISGLAPGEYTVSETTPPTGYGPGTAVDNTATAASGTDCGTSKPTTTNSAVFTDPPLYDLQVNFKDDGSGETSATISCPALDPADSTSPPSPYTTSKTYTNRSAPQIVTCTITVDP